MKISTTLFFSLVGISAASSAGTLVYYSYNSQKIVVENKVEDSSSVTTDPTNTETKNSNDSRDTNNANNYSLGLEDFPT